MKKQNLIDIFEALKSDIKRSYNFNDWIELYNFIIGTIPHEKIKDVLLNGLKNNFLNLLLEIDKIIGIYYGCHMLLIKKLEQKRL